MPSEGPVAGITVATLQDTDFVHRDELYCSFGSYRQHATSVASNTLRCVVPPSLRLTTPLSPSRRRLKRPRCTRPSPTTICRAPPS